MSVELPKDAEGREIPLDTALLYGKVSGEEYEVVCFNFRPSMRQWRVELKRRDDFGIYATENFTLSTPDSWEKLLDDLCEALEQGGRSGNPVCAYLAARGLCRGRMDEEGRCKLSDASFCANGMVSNIRGRIKRLCAGDGERDRSEK